MNIIKIEVPNKQPAFYFKESILQKFTKEFIVYILENKGYEKIKIKYFPKYLHREDGPAIEFSDSNELRYFLGMTNKYYYNGKLVKVYSNEEYLKYVSDMKFKEKLEEELK